MRVAVVGCGIFGAVTALRLAGDHDVTVFERAAEPLTGASFNNQNRLHRGFHYPRDPETARSCAKGYESFRTAFPSCVVDVPSTYYIASGGSLTSPEEYLRFVEGLGVPYHVVDAIPGTSLGVAASEAIVDCTRLRGDVRSLLGGACVKTIFGAEVTAINHTDEGFLVEVYEQPRDEFEAVVVCTYADINRLGVGLGHVPREFQYEYTVMPIVEWDHEPVSITVMDGPFVTVNPYGAAPGRFLLYHVEKSVVAREVGTSLPPPPTVDMDTLGQDILRACTAFVPEFASARIVGFLQGPRIVLPHREATDARPSIVRQVEPGYIDVFAGKIDQCFQAANEVVEMLGVKCD